MAQPKILWPGHYRGRVGKGLGYAGREVCRWVVYGGWEEDGCGQSLIFEYYAFFVLIRSLASSHNLSRI